GLPPLLTEERVFDLDDDRTDLPLAQRVHAADDLDRAPLVRREEIDDGGVGLLPAGRVGAAAGEAPVHAVLVAKPAGAAAVAVPPVEEAEPGQVLLPRLPVEHDLLRRFLGAVLVALPQRHRDAVDEAFELRLQRAVEDHVYFALLERRIVDPDVTEVRRVPG